MTARGAVMFVLTPVPPDAVLHITTAVPVIASAVG